MPPFTVSQAQALVPLLQKEMSVLLPSYLSLRRIWEETATLNQLSVDDPEVRNQCLSDLRAQRALRQIESSLSFFEELGVECCGIEEGIFGFPCLLGDRFVLLSWQLDDQEVAYWHEFDLDFTCRRPLIDLNSQSERMLIN